MKVFQNSGSVPDSLQGTNEEKSSTDTVIVRTLVIVEDGSNTVEGDVGLDDTIPSKTFSIVEVDSALDDERHSGVDPYNTSRFEAAK